MCRVIPPHISISDCLMKRCEEEEQKEDEHKKYVHKEEEQEEEEDTVPVIPVGCISISAALIIMGQMLTRHSGIR